MPFNNFPIKKQIHSIGIPAGTEILHDPFFNKGMAFTEKERDVLGLWGLLPPKVLTIEQQEERFLNRLRKQPTDLDKYITMISLQDRNRTLFYKVLMDNLEELTPIIYTPTVGKACEEYGNIFRRSRGIYISANHRGRMTEILKNWPYQDIKIIVVTDGSRILGLGDLGANGMGIPVGKLSLYTACAGIHPYLTLPVTLDIGTDNENLLGDTSYVGLNQNRLKGKEYDEFMEEFIDSVKMVFPEAMIQFEDFSTDNAFNLLEKYRNKISAFNDDIQGTGASALAGIYSSLRITGKKLKDMNFLFIGAGEAGVGIGNTISSAMTQEGLTIEQARKHCFFFDINGLIVKSRDDISQEQLPFAHKHEPLKDFNEAVKTIQPDAIIGVSGCPGMFSETILKSMAEINERPVIFAMSNPTSKSECTAYEAYKLTDGKAVFASGSPFDPVEYKNKTYVTGQANNVYIFPGVGLGAMAVKSKHVTDEMFSIAAKTVADHVTDKELESGCLYPSLTRIRELCLEIGVRVAEISYDQNLAQIQRPDNLKEFIKKQMYQPVYHNYF